jgi:hypothetical protein
MELFVALSLFFGAAVDDNGSRTTVILKEYQAKNLVDSKDYEDYLAKGGLDLDDVKGLPALDVIIVEDPWE